MTFPIIQVQSVFQSFGSLGIQVSSTNDIQIGIMIPVGIEKYGIGIFTERIHQVILKRLLDKMMTCNLNKQSSGMFTRSADKYVLEPVAVYICLCYTGTAM